MRYLTFMTLLFLFSCNDESSDLVVVAPSAALLEAPSPDAPPVATLAMKEGLKDLGKVSRFETTLVFNGVERRMPWIEVQNRQGAKGWIWMGWATPTSGDSTLWVQSKRLLCYFGPKVYAQYQKHRRSEAIQTSPEFFGETVRLRDSVVYALHHRAEAGRAAPESDWTWLTEAMPGFVFQTIEPGNRPYLFFHYGYWLERSRATADSTDDVFFETLCSLYPTDSIESFYPVWTIQTDLNQGCSQLGLGRHEAVLLRLDHTLKSCPTYEQAVFQIKNRLLDDVLNKENCYWQNEKKILTELNSILNKKFNCLTQRDVLALKARASMFENAQANGIRVNLRSGE